MEELCLTRRPTLVAPKIAITYLLVGVIWAYVANLGVTAANLSNQMAFAVQVYYVVGFLAASSLLIYYVVRCFASRLEKFEDERILASMRIAHRLAMAIELRDQCTKGHNHRLGKYAQIVAGELGIDADQCELLYHAAALHDIGKIGVPDEILNKPGPLTEAERRIIERHVRLGAEILVDDNDPLMKLARAVVLTHHESWDGNGYPAGLREHEIPIEGRIAAVCDMFDALLSPRPYKLSWDVEEVVKEIARLSGKKFDPAVVSAFERVVPKLMQVYQDDSMSDWERYQQDLELPPPKMVRL